VSTIIGIVILVIVFAMKYGGSVASGIGWLRGKLPAIPSISSAITSKPATPTASQAFAALEIITRFKAGSSADPSYGMVIAALKHTQEAA
jgi:hypothetical protein